MDLESFLNYQCDSILNSIFLEGIDEELAQLVKRHEPDWATMHIRTLATITDKLPKPYRKEKKKGPPRL